MMIYIFYAHYENGFRLYSCYEKHHVDIIKSCNKFKSINGRGLYFMYMQT